MTAVEAIMITLVSASLAGSAWVVGASMVSGVRARNGQSQVTNVGIAAMNELLNDTLEKRSEDRGRIEALIGVISRAAARLRDASGRHASAHATSGIACPYFEQYQNSIELVVIYLEQAIETEDK